jgi:integrase
VSRFVFDKSIRPQLTEKRHGPRTIRFSKVELDQYLADADSMFTRRTVSDALDHAWELKWKSSRGPKKKDSLRKQVDKEIGDVRLSKLDYNRIEKWVIELQDDDRAVATIKSRLSCLGYALKLAAKKGWIKAIPQMPEMEIGARKLRYLKDDPDEEQILLDACGALEYRICDVMRLAIVFMLDTGCRLSELLKLRWGGMSAAGALFEERKAGDNLRVPLTPRAREAAEALLGNAYWMLRVRGADLDKQRMTSAQNWFTHQFAKARDKAKLHDVSAHTLRHTCASRLVQAGVSLYEVRQLLGHSSITVTERYAHLAPSSLDRAVAVLTNRSLPDKVTSMRPKSQ